MKFSKFFTVLCLFYWCIAIGDAEALITHRCLTRLAANLTVWKNQVLTGTSADQQKELRAFLAHLDRIVQLSQANKAPYYFFEDETIIELITATQSLKLSAEYRRYLGPPPSVLTDLLTYIKLYEEFIDLDQIYLRPQDYFRIVLVKPDLQLTLSEKDFILEQLQIWDSIDSPQVASSSVTLKEFPTVGRQVDEFIESEIDVVSNQDLPKDDPIVEFFHSVSLNSRLEARADFFRGVQHFLEVERDPIVLGDFTVKIHPLLQDQSHWKNRKKRPDRFRDKMLETVHRFWQPLFAANLIAAEKIQALCSDPSFSSAELADILMYQYQCNKQTHTFAMGEVNIFPVDSFVAEDLVVSDSYDDFVRIAGKRSDFELLNGYFQVEKENLFLLRNLKQTLLKKLNFNGLEKKTAQLDRNDQTFLSHHFLRRLKKLKTDYEKLYTTPLSFPRWQRAGKFAEHDVSKIAGSTFRLLVMNRDPRPFITLEDLRKRLSQANKIVNQLNTLSLKVDNALTTRKSPSREKKTSEELKIPELPILDPQIDALLEVSKTIRSATETNAKSTRNSAVLDSPVAEHSATERDQFKLLQRERLERWRTEVANERKKSRENRDAASEILRNTSHSAESGEEISLEGNVVFLSQLYNRKLKPKKARILEKIFSNEKSVLRMSEVKHLIKRLKGVYYPATKSSHVWFSLPNTFTPIAEQVFLVVDRPEESDEGEGTDSDSENYNDTKLPPVADQIKSGVVNPHGKAHHGGLSPLNLSLLRAGFKKVGLTPDRLRKADLM